MKLFSPVILAALALFPLCGFGQDGNTEAKAIAEELSEEAAALRALVEEFEAQSAKENANQPQKVPTAAADPKAVTKSPAIAIPEPPSIITPPKPTIIDASDLPPLPTSSGPVVETPVIKAPTIDPPVIKTPAVETPVVKTPTIETPIVKAPTVEVPEVKAPAIETPVVKTPSLVISDDKAKIEAPVIKPMPIPEKPAVAVNKVEETVVPSIEKPIESAATIVDAAKTEMKENVAEVKPAIPSVEIPTVEAPVVETPVVVEKPVEKIATVEDLIASSKQEVESIRKEMEAAGTTDPKPTIGSDSIVIKDDPVTTPLKPEEKIDVALENVPEKMSAEEAYKAAAEKMKAEMNGVGGHAVAPVVATADKPKPNVDTNPTKELGNTATKKKEEIKKATDKPLVVANKKKSTSKPTTKPASTSTNKKTTDAVTPATTEVADVAPSASARHLSPKPFGRLFQRKGSIFKRTNTTNSTRPSVGNNSPSN